MREMKDSGVEWIGKIPKDWEIVPLTKQLDSIVDYRGKTPEKTEEGTFLVTAKNIKDGKICYELSKEYVREADYEEIMHRGIPQIGDILFTTEAPLGQVANVDRTDIALPWQVLTVCMPILHRYADYLTRIFIDSVFIQNSYTQCFLRDMVERR